MSRWVVLFEDTAQMIEHRKKQGTKHAQYALENKGEILIGGGFRETPDGQFVGGMWVMEVSSRERAVELIENDPYYHADYRKYKLYTWGKILENVSVTL